MRESFKNDFDSFQIISIDSLIIEFSCQMLEKYGNNGLRSLDALQLAAAISVKQIVDRAITSDVLLNSFLIAENFKTLDAV